MGKLFSYWIPFLEMNGNGVVQLLKQSLHMKFCVVFRIKYLLTNLRIVISNKLYFKAT